MASKALLSLVDLRQCLTILLDELERKHGMIVDLDADYYWTVGPGEAFRFDAGGPPEPTVGQLTDDMQGLRNLLAGGADHSVVLWHDLAHAIGIFSRLAALDQTESSSDGWMDLVAQTSRRRFAMSGCQTLSAVVHGCRGRTFRRGSAARRMDR